MRWRTRCNPRDRSYSVPQLLEFLDRGGLTFSRWYLQAPYLPQCGAIAATPHATRLAALSERDQYAAVELWRQAAVKKDAAALRRRLGVLGAAVCLAAVAAAPAHQRQRRSVVALDALNRSRAAQRLILVINAEEKQMVDAIDGRRTIADIVDRMIQPPSTLSTRGPSKNWGGTIRWSSTRRRLPELHSPPIDGPDIVAFRSRRGIRLLLCPSDLGRQV
jgi:hypothetical protein